MRDGNAARGERSVVSVGSIETYRAALRSFVARRIANPHEAEDLVQEACARLIATAQARDLDEPQAYLFRIAANLIADRHRRSLPFVPLEDEHQPAVRPAQEDARRVADLQRALESALDELSPRCRQVFVLRRFDDRATGEIAAQLGISTRMVQKYMTQAMSHLYDRLSHLTEHAS